MSFAVHDIPRDPSRANTYSVSITCVPARVWRTSNTCVRDQSLTVPIPLSTHIRGETRFGALKSQRPISRADTAPRLNAAMSQSLQKREDLTGQSQCRRSRTDARPANFHIRGETSRGVGR